jgi:uncharacterized protein
MEEHPDVTLVRQGMDAFSRGDVAAVEATFADDVEWHNPPGNHPFTGDQHGKQETLAFFGRLMESGIQLTFDIHDVVGNDDHVVGLVKVNGSRSDGRTFEDLNCFGFHVEGGKITEFWGHNRDAAAADAFFA